MAKSKVGGKKENQKEAGQNPCGGCEQILEEDKFDKSGGPIKSGILEKMIN